MFHVKQVPSGSVFGPVFHVKQTISRKRKLGTAGRSVRSFPASSSWRRLLLCMGLFSRFWFGASTHAGPDPIYSRLRLKI